jgi:hypothetical protein
MRVEYKTTPGGLLFGRVPRGVDGSGNLLGDFVRVRPGVTVVHEGTSPVFATGNEADMTPYVAPLTTNPDGEVPGWLAPGVYTTTDPSTGESVTFEVGGASETRTSALEGQVAAHDERFLSVETSSLATKTARVVSRDYWLAIDADDTNACQRAVDAAIAQNRAIEFVPLDDNDWLTISDTITFGTGTPGSPARFSMNMYFDVGGLNTSVRWTGGNNKAVFKTWGMNVANIYNAKINLPTTAEGVVCWDQDVASASTQNSSTINWYGCHIFGGKVASANIGWRLGHSSAGNDLSNSHWWGCTVVWGGQRNMGYGWVIEGNNSINFSWTGGGAAFCTVGWTSVPTAGGAGGGISMYWKNISASLNEIDYQITAGGTYTWDGGRYELGKRFLDMPHTNTNLTFTITVSGIWLGVYIPADGIVFNVVGAVNLKVASSFFERRVAAQAGALSGVPYDGNFVTATALGTAHGNVTFHDNSLYADDLPVTIASDTTGEKGTWRVEGKRNIKVSVDNTVAARFPDTDDIRGLLGAALAAWYRTDAISGKDGDAIGQWDDLSGNARHLLQANGAKQPLLKRGMLNGQPVVRFDGVDDFIQASFTFAQPYEFWVVGRLLTQTSNHVLLTGANNLQGQFDYSGGTNMQAYAGTALLGSASPVATAHVFNVRFNGASSHVRVDGKTTVTGNAGTGAPNGVTLGAHPGGALGLANTEVAEVIVVNVGTLTLSQRSKIQHYLRDKYGTAR